jgi:tetratricopeptide (TPR) repeat protein
VLVLEDEAGEELPTQAGDLIRALRGKPPHLVFLSACLTAVGGRDEPSSVLAQSLVESMVDGGFPTVLGWDGSVGDRAASAFAVQLYDALAHRRDLADAVAGARQALLNQADNTLRNNWHLARLWLGPDGGGPLVGGARRRNLVPSHGEKEFLVKEQRKLPVASHQMFVGRRHELQTVLRALRDDGHAGVLLHGMGRLGKSSLAARVANRRPDLKLAVVFEHYGASDILAAIRDALQENRDARELLRQATQLVSNEPERFEDSLVDLVRAPCMQAGNNGTPLLLLIDDLERILDPGPTGPPHRIKSDFAPVIQAVLRAFDRTTDCRLILTSRFKFALNGLDKRLFAVPLPPLSEAAQVKLELRQREAATDNVLAGSESDKRAELLRRVPLVARGNPGLQDVIGRRIVLSTSVTLEHADQTLGETESWLTQGDLPSDPDVRQFLENLDIEFLIDLAGDAGKALLRGLTLFNLPVPEAVADQVAKIVGGRVQHLRDLGLVDALQDLVDHTKVAVAINALAAARLELLTERDSQSLARSIAQPLFLAWGGAAGKRPLVCDRQLTALGLAAKDGEIVAACAARALFALDGVPASERSAFGQSAIALLDAQERTPPLRLLSETAQAASIAGDGATADAVAARGAELVAQQRAAGSVVDPMVAAFVLYAQADRLVLRGNLDQAERLFKQTAEFAAAAGNEISATTARGRIADIFRSRGDLDEALRILREEMLPVFERLGDVQKRAVVMGRIADILESRGDVDEALRIRQEDMLPVFERLGEVRERTATLGAIAQTLHHRGDLDEARKLQSERLKVNRQLGDADGIANALWDLAKLDLEQKKFKNAAPRLAESYRIVLRLGRADAIAVIGLVFGQVLAAGEEPQEALEVLRRSAEIFRKLGRESQALEAEKLIIDMIFHHRR